MPKIFKKCLDCEKDFYLNQKDQEFFQKMGFPEPKRCFSCRKLRKVNQPENKEQE